MGWTLDWIGLIWNNSVLIIIMKINWDWHGWLQLVRLRSYQYAEKQLANCLSSIIVYTARHALYLQFPMHFVEIECKFANLHHQIVNLLNTVTWAAVASGVLSKYIIYWKFVEFCCICNFFRHKCILMLLNEYKKTFKLEISFQSLT